VGVAAASQGEDRPASVREREMAEKEREMARLEREPAAVGDPRNPYLPISRLDVPCVAVAIG